MPSNKLRVYVALHFCASITSNPQLRKDFGYAAYHWAINIETKDGENCHAYDVKKRDYYPNILGSSAWQYNSLSLTRKSRTLLCKIMIGKLPPTFNPEQVGEMLNEASIPLPRDDTNPIENCVTWTRQAIQVLQQKGCAENLNIEKLMNFALQKADLCYNKNPQLTAGSKRFNATSRPM